MAIEATRFERTDGAGSRRRAKALEERLWSKVDFRAPDACWPWTGATTAAGYGVMWVGRPEQEVEYAHRLAFTFVKGPIRRGKEIDHLCHNRDPDCSGGSTCIHRRCANPAHLEDVTRRTNFLRGKHPSAVAYRASHKVQP